MPLASKSFRCMFQAPNFLSCNPRHLTTKSKKSANVGIFHLSLQNLPSPHREVKEIKTLEQGVVKHMYLESWDRKIENSRPAWSYIARPCLKTKTKQKSP
jgi:hypothetical protein